MDYISNCTSAVASQCRVLDRIGLLRALPSVLDYGHHMSSELSANSDWDSYISIYS